MSAEARYGCGRPYPAASMLRARELYEIGWRPPQIRRMLVGEGLPAPDVRTVLRWVDEEGNARALERAKRWQERAGAERASFRLGGARGSGRKGPSKPYQDAFVATLREAGVADPETLGKVCRVVLGDSCHPITATTTASSRRGPKGLTGDEHREMLHRLLELRTAHPWLTYSALALIANEYHGAGGVTADKLRYQLTRMGAPRNQKKARATREVMAARKMTAESRQ